jgi:hypothetical protein
MDVENSNIDQTLQFAFNKEHRLGSLMPKQESAEINKQVRAANFLSLPGFFISSLPENKKTFASLL